jgi:N-acetylglucosaminyldiphosphoundecaprenol N-acetyl-beta-D-mannosaminyltransferase
MKKQEEWIDQNLDKLNVKIVLGVGRSFDYYSGELKRAPKWARKMGLEWLYSLIREPKRWRRQLALPKFVWEVINEKC